MHTQENHVAPVARTTLKFEPNFAKTKACSKRKKLWIEDNSEFLVLMKRSVKLSGVMESNLGFGSNINVCQFLPNCIKFIVSLVLLFVNQNAFNGVR